MTVAFDREPSEFVIECFDVLDVRLVEYGISTAELPSDQLYRKATSHHDARGFRVDPDVVLCGRRHVAFATGCSSHHHAAAYICGDSGLFRKCQSDIGERTQCDENKSRVCLYRFHNS